jgi:hypothetical protein
MVWPLTSNVENVPHCTRLDKERIATSTPESEAGVLVVRRHHHRLVRCSYWLNLTILLDLILSGRSIYWASPVYQHNQIQESIDPSKAINVTFTSDRADSESHALKKSLPVLLPE